MSEYRLPSIDDFADAEHCVLEDVTAIQPALFDGTATTILPAREISDEFVIQDTLRGRRTSVCLYAEGWADIGTTRRRESTVYQRFNLSFLDPAPETTRHFPVVLWKLAGVLALVAAVCVAARQLGFSPAWVWQTGIAAGAASFGCALVAFYRSYQRIVFRTRHGRAEAIRLHVGLGAGYPLGKCLPRITELIAEAASRRSGDRAANLRSEMREHYRLRAEGVLSEEECAEATDRILGSFDGTR